MTFSKLVFNLHSIGYSIEEIDDMSIGFMQDMIIEFSNSKLKSKETNKENEPSFRWATQEDFDRL